MSDILGSFLKSVRVRTKHAKTRIDLWGQLPVLKVV